MLFWPNYYVGYSIKIILILQKLFEKVLLELLFCLFIYSDYHVNTFPTMLAVECFPPCLVLFLFLQILFCKVFLGACCVISSKKACCRLVPTILFGLAYNSWKNDPTCAEIFEKKHNWDAVLLGVSCLKTYLQISRPGWSVFQINF